MPNPTEQYEDYYSEHDPVIPDIVGKSLDQVVAGFEPYRRTNLVIDVGFGAGCGLQAARRAGWDAVGVEVSEPAIEPARAMGFEVFKGELHQAGYPDDTFDVVMMSEVLEHLNRPRDLLLETLRILRPGGLLWATTPHGRGISARILGVDWSIVSPPEHQQLFSRQGLLTLLTSAGFEPRRLISRAVNPYELISRLRQRYSVTSNGPEPNRVECGYQMLETIESSSTLQIARRVADRMLDLTRLGDSLKLWATTPSLS